ncbi:Uncharacterized protein conserved in bacteria [Plesiomonas shigelloides]|uniref:lysozyme inhibitor LprI family protein n=1 Tax=Plesiomonas shigelloides TaxID=703 RepID=UPI0007EE0EB9|nr:lysozyme inhibitor LprI family protein [Plesiomonas shigelloides]SBT60919.1 Uncharacterized protein conserved in bacteria [Plesiomonas shigelloides]
MFEKILLVLLGILLSAIGYLIKRKIENRPQIESLDKHKKLLDIHKQMNEQGIDIEGLKELEAKLTGKAAAIQRNAIALQSTSVPLIGENQAEEITQSELNSRAALSFESAKVRMHEVFSQLERKVDSVKSQSLMNSQTEWNNYSVSQAEAAAATYQGGSIYPLIYFSELESLTNERTARLQAELDEFIRLGM